MRARKVMTVIAWTAGVLGLLLLVGWLGFQVQPTPFPAYPDTRPASIETTALPTELPAPVERFYRVVYGERIPVLTSAVLSGRARVRPAGPMYLPARYRFTHEAGQGYRHYIEVCWFNIPVLRINERYLDGAGLMEIPVIGTASGPQVDSAANQGMWAESWQFPSLLVTDPRVRWEPVDAETAVLVVPSKGAEQQRFVVRFDPETGLPTWTETMRFKDSASTEQTLWMTRFDEWGEVDGVLTMTVGSAIWMDDGSPWATFILEDMRLNVDVSEYVRGRGL